MAVRWLRAHAAEHGYDAKRFGCWGGSAGGHLTALLVATGGSREFDVGSNLEQSSAIQCGIDFYGPADLLGWKAPGTHPGIQRGGDESIFVRLLGGSIDEKIELARKASPVMWVTKDCAPLFIMHGTVDPLVGLEQSQMLAEKMKAAGVDVTLEVVEGGGRRRSWWSAVSCWGQAAAAAGFSEQALDATMRLIPSPSRTAGCELSKFC